jgi:hypothetical protein
MLTQLILHDRERKPKGHVGLTNALAIDDTQAAGRRVACRHAAHPALLRRVCSRSPYCATWSHCEHAIGRGLSAPPGVTVPEAVQKALQNGSTARRSTSKRESMQRATKWWLPYMILEFDRSQMLVEAIDGDLANPIYNYRTPLYVHRSPALFAALMISPATSSALQMSSDPSTSVHRSPLISISPCPRWTFSSLASSSLPPWTAL